MKNGIIGISQIPIHQHQCCYFIKRPFGNLLLFADELHSIDESVYFLMSSSGGLAKIILESTTSINDLHGKLFDQYGASIVCNTEREHFDLRAKVQRLKDFADPQLKFIFTPHYNLIILNQKKLKVMIAGNMIFYDGKQIFSKQQNITSFIHELQVQEKIDLIYFTHFQKNSALSFRKINLMSHLTDSIFSFLKQKKD